jgi:glycosyltransferase involved in cell wall biosynthesis
MAHAMASRGHRVTLAAELAPGAGRAEDVLAPGVWRVEDVLAWYGLLPVPTLRLVCLPRSRTLASVAFRAVFAWFMVETRGKGIVTARSKRYAREMIRLCGARLPLFIEAHEVDSLQAAERGEDPRPWRALEEEVFGAARGIVTNAPGTLALLRQAHAGLPPSVAAQNGTHASRVRAPHGRGEGIGYVGSVRDTKDLSTLARAAGQLPWPVHLVGPDAAEASDLVRLSEGRLRVEPGLAHRDVPDRLNAFRVLVLPLGKGLFGERLSSPLKLWDYLASGVPMVGADLPALHEAAPGMFHPYAPGDEKALGAAIDAVATDEGLRARLLANVRVRTWADRAEEVERFVESVL